MESGIDRPTLEANSICVEFGGVRALDSVSIAVCGERVHAILGPNGAGKTTLFNVMCGLVTPTTGSIQLCGRDVTNARPMTRAQLGLGRTFQVSSLFWELSVSANLALAERSARRRLDGRDERGGTGDTWLERIGLSHAAVRPARSLSYGDRRVLELGIVLAQRPRVALLDEPSAGVSPADIPRMAELIRELVSEGVAVVLVEHDMSLVFDVADVVTVLDGGRKIAEGSPAEIAGDTEVRRVYLGTSR